MQQGRRAGRDAGTSASVLSRFCKTHFDLSYSPAAVGSARYHLEPNNATLAWDRLGMVGGGCGGCAWNAECIMP